MGIGQHAALAAFSGIGGIPAGGVYGIAAGVVVVVALVAALVGRRAGRRSLSQRLIALGSRLGVDPPNDNSSIETAVTYLEQVTGSAAEAVTDASADAIRLRRSLDTLPQGLVLCDESGTVVYRNARANALMTSRHGDALAAQAVTELLEDAWHEGTAERTLDLYGPPRRTLTVRAELIDDGRRPLGAIAIIEDVSERRRLEEIRRDFVANVSHELKTPMGALGLLAETLVAEPDAEVAQRLASRIHTEAFRVSRIIDDLLDLSRIESEQAPPRGPVLVNLVMAEAVERVRATAEQRGIRIELEEPDPPVAVLGDRRQLVSAMHALLENAVTYSYDDSTVTVSGRLGLDDGEPTRSGGVLATAVASTAPPTQAAVAGPLPDGGGPPGSEPAVGWAGPGGGEGTTPFAAPSGTASVAGGAAGEPGAAEGEDRRPGLPDGGEPSGRVTASRKGTAVPEARSPEARRREMVFLSVADHGIGIPARDLERIFERFYRVDHGRSRDTGGTGLGLSIVRHVATNHQGRVDVESREGEGSTFTLVLPVHQERAA
jgi:signal transduction histidine kinase